MVDTPFFKDWWAEARNKDGLCEFTHTWWDSSADKAPQDKIVPALLSDEKLLDTICKGALMKLPSHYYANYTDATWGKLADTVGLSIVNKKFSDDGKLVRAVLSLNLYKSMFIETEEMANSVDVLFTRWAQFCKDYPGAAMNLFVRSEQKMPVISVHAYHGLNEGQRLVAEAAFESLMQDLKNDAGLVSWVENMVKRGGNYAKSFRISEDLWFGQDNPTNDLVMEEIKRQRELRKQGTDSPTP